MKPILVKNMQTFLKRFDNFKDGEFRSIDVISPSVMQVTFAGQDEGRAFDWITVTFEFSGVSDARIIENSKLSFIDMSDGISIVNENNKFAFGVGKYSNESSIKNSTCYMICSDLKYQEGQF